MWSCGGAFNVLMGFVSFVPNKKKARFRYSFLLWCRIHFVDKAVPHFADKLLYLGFSFIIWSLNYNWVSKRWLTIMNISFYFLLSFLFTIEYSNDYSYLSYHLMLFYIVTNALFLFLWTIASLSIYLGRMRNALLLTHSMKRCKNNWLPFFSFLFNVNPLSILTHTICISICGWFLSSFSLLKTLIFVDIMSLFVLYYLSIWNAICFGIWDFANICVCWIVILLWRDMLCASCLAARLHRTVAP